MQNVLFSPATCFGLLKKPLCYNIYHINFNVYTFTDPMPENSFGSLRLANNFPKIFWLISLALGAQITDLD